MFHICFAICPTRHTPPVSASQRSTRSPSARAPTGWTPLRQAEFIGVLAETGSVSAAAAFVGMARETAYRLRRRADAAEFARAWDVALVVAGVMPASFLERTACSRKVTPRPSWRQVVDGLWRPVVRRGRYVGSVRKADNSALLGYLAQLDRSFRASRKDLRAELRSQTQKRPSASGSPGRPEAPLRPGRTRA